MSERAGRWERVKDLGSGGFGMVVLWRNVSTDQQIAIKQCRWGEPGTEALMVPKVRERWRKEVEIMLKLNHRGIVSCMPLPADLQGDPAALPRLCMEYCQGGDLRRVLLRPENCCGLPELEVRQLLSDITDALGYLHGLRIIHRDLKPENVVLQRAEGRVLYKLIDLGYAKELDQSSVCTSFVGTLQYLAPELFLSNRYTSTADYWSLGLVAHEVVTGVRPFLPNMPPAMWMHHVSQKGPDDICAEQLEDGTIEFRSEITECNQISTPLRRHLEVWLRRLLDWEPRRRGRAPTTITGPPGRIHRHEDRPIFRLDRHDDGPPGRIHRHDDYPLDRTDRHEDGPHERTSWSSDQQQQQLGPVVAFSQLQQLLRRRVVALFCEPRCQLLHAEITESSTVGDLQTFITREAGLEPSHQRLCLPSGGGRPVRSLQTDPAQSALQCWAPPEEPDWLVYVFDSEGGPGEAAPVSLPLPPLVRAMLQNTEHRPDYYRQRAVFAQSVFLIQQQVKLLRLRENARHVHMQCVAASLSHLSRLGGRLTAAVAGLQAATALFLAALSCDDEHYSRQAAEGGITSDNAYRRWRAAGDHLRRRLQQHRLRAQQLTADLTEVRRRWLELQDAPAAGHKPDDLSQFYDRACQAYDSHRRRPKEQRSRCTNNAEMIRIVAKFLMHRDKPFERVQEAIRAQQVVERQALALFQPLQTALEDVQAALELVTRCQRQRQQQIWQLMRFLLHNRPAPGAAAAAAEAASDGAAGPPPAASDREGGMKETAAADSACDIVLLSGLLDSATLETSGAVAENLSLHAEIGELLQATDTVPPPDGEQIDWSFLN